MSATTVCKSARPSRRTSPVAYVAEPPDPDDPLLGFAPYLHKQPRRNAITPERQRAFIAALAATGIVTQAAKAIGASLEALYKLRHRPGAEEFAAAWEAALDRGIARLEDCAVALAIEGEEIPIVRGGEVVATWRKHNFPHIRFVLSQRRDERFAGHRGRLRLEDLGPGHPVYDGLRQRWETELAERRKAERAQVLASLDAKLEDMRQRRRANSRDGEQI